MITLENTNDIPDLPGVYYFKQEGVSIYIGKSVNLRARVRSHIQQAQLSKKEYAIVSQADTLEWSTTCLLYTSRAWMAISMLTMCTWLIKHLLDEHLDRIPQHILEHLMSFEIFLPKHQMQRCAAIKKADSLLM